MDSESGQSESSTIDHTRRIVKYFSKCLIELVKHTESIQYKNNKLINYDVSSTFNSDSGNEMDITEHNIKTEIRKEGPIFKQIEKMKQCIVELLTICSQQNISIDYDTTKSDVTIYDGFDDSQRVLVMNHLTLNVLSLVENIYLSVKLLKYKNMDNGQQIKKTFSNIYKEIKSLPMRPDIIDNMDSSFKSLTHKSEYKDSYNYLVEKLNILSKHISKFNKVYQKNCGYDILSMEDSTDDDNTPRKKIKNRILEKSYVKPENDELNGDKEQEAVFKVPVSINNVNSNMDAINSNETPKKKNRKANANTDKEVYDNCESTKNINAYSDETPKKKKRKISDTNKEVNTCEEQESVLNEIPETLENITATIDATCLDKTPKNKRNINTDTETNDNCESMNDTNENMDTTNISSDEASKNNRKINNDAGNEINTDEEQESILNISSNMITTNKHVSQKSKKQKTNSDTKKETNDESAKISERDLLLSELLNDSMKEINKKTDTGKKSKKKKKNKKEHQDTSPEKSIDNENNSNKKQHNNTESSNKENNSNKCENVETTNNKKKRKSIDNEPLYKSTQDNTIEKSPTNKNKKATKQKPKNAKKGKTEQIKKSKVNTTKVDAVPADNNQSFDELNEEEFNNLSHHFLCVEHNETDNVSNYSDNDELNAISSESIEINYDNTDFEEYMKIIKQNNLNEHERYLYIQDLVEAANAKIAITEEKKEKLRNLKILVDWEVCPAHLVCFNLSLRPNEEEKQLLEKYGVTSGVFTKKEDEIIRENWNTFCQNHDLEDDPAPFMVVVVDKEKLLEHSDRIKFVQHIGRGLPNKSLHSIYRRFKHLFKPKVKYGRFSPEEDELILTYINKIKRNDNKQKYARLAPLINRDRCQIERRYRTLRQTTLQQSSKKTKWSLELQEKFLKHLLEETQSASVEDLRDKYIDLEMYTLIGKLMNMSPHKLKVHWKFRMHTELFAGEPINIDLIRIKLIKKFWELKYDDWKIIDWELMKTMFNGITKSYLWISLKNAMRDYVPNNLHENLKDCIDYLYNEILPILEKRYMEDKSNIAPRLTYKNGTLRRYK